MVKAVVLIIFFLFSVSIAKITPITYGSSLYDSLSTTSDDTIVLTSGSGLDSSFELSSDVYISSNVLITSTAGNMHSILLNVGGMIGIRTTADSVTFRRIKFIDTVGTAGGTVSSIDINNANVTIEDCVFWNNNDYSTNFRAVNLSNASTINVNIRRCLFHNLNNALYAGSDSAGSGKIVTISNCIFDTTNIVFGQKWTLDTCIFTGGVPNTISFGTDSVVFNNCWFDKSSSGTGRYIDFTASSTAPTTGNSLNNCVFINNDATYVHLRWWRNSTVTNNRFITTLDGGINIYDSRGGAAGTTDSSWYRVQIVGNTFYGPTEASYVITHGTSDTKDSIVDCRFAKNLVLGLGIINTVNEMARDTVDSCVWQNNVNNGAWSVTTDTVSGAGIAFVTDSSIYGFHKQNSAYVWAGDLEKLFTILDTSAITDTNITWACSLSTRLRHSNGIIHDTVLTADSMLSFLKTNSWFTGDTATYVIDTSTDKVSWGAAGDTVILAGQTVALTTDNLSASTLYYIRQRVYDTDQGLYDTSAIDSFTTAAGEGGGCTKATATTDNVSDTVGNTVYMILDTNVTPDSVTFLSRPDSAWYIPGTDTVGIELRHIVTAAPCSLVVHSCSGDSLDTLVPTITAVWDTASIDSMRRVSDGANWGYGGELCRVYLSFGSNGGNIDSAKMADSSLNPTNITSTTFDIILPLLDQAGMINLIVSDSVASDTLLSAFNYRGLLPTYQITASVNVAVRGSVLPADTTVDSNGVATIIFAGTDSTQLDSIVTTGTLDTAISATYDTIRVTAHSAGSVTFYYSLVQYDIDTTGGIIGNGTWSITPGITGLPHGTQMTYSATADNGYKFGYYSMGGVRTYNPDTSFAISGNRTDSVFFFLTPVIDSVKSQTRRDFYWSVARVLDTIWVYAVSSSFGEEGDSSKVFVGSGQDFNWPHFSWSADSIGLIVPEGTESKYFRISVRSSDMVMSDLPANHNFYVKTPGGL